MIPNPRVGVETWTIYVCDSCGAEHHRSFEGRHCHAYPGTLHGGVGARPQVPHYECYGTVHSIEVVPLSALLAEREARERAERDVKKLIGDYRAALDDAKREWDRAEQAEAERDRLRDALGQLGAEILNNRDRTARGEPKDWQAALDFIRARASLSPDPSGETGTVN